MKLKELLKLQSTLPIDMLNADEMKELQNAVVELGYSDVEIDGLLSSKIRDAWAKFKTDVNLDSPNFIDFESISKLQERLSVKIINNDNNDFSTEDGTKKAIKLECISQGLELNTQISYVLATTQLETANTFQPVREAFWLSESWRENNLRYFPYYGRGYVQLTWEKNYEKYSDILGVDMVRNPDLALNPDIALFILVDGFKKGFFTGLKITDFINENETDFIKARRCINGDDRADDIAQIANEFLNEF